MRITRREFFKYCTIAAGALGLTSSDLLKLKDVMAKVGSTPVVWLQGASCTGDSTSLLNSIFYTDPVGLLIANDVSTSIDLRFHQTVMNASGTDLAGVSPDAIDSAQSVLSGSSANTYAIWSSKTWSIGSESIELKIADRHLDTLQAYAEITPEAPVLINHFDINFKVKIGESQAPFVEIDVENQDTADKATLLSCYPATWDSGEGRWDAIIGPTDWRTVTLSNFPYWQDTAEGAPGPLFIDATNDGRQIIPPGVQTIPHGVAGVGPPGADGTFPGQPGVWMASAFHAVGDVVMQTGGTNPIWLECIGVSGAQLSAGAIAWPTTTGTTVIDNELTWRSIAASPALIDPPAPWTRWYDLRDTYGTWKVVAVRIINQGDPAVQLDPQTPHFSDSCTMYVDDISIAGIFYADRSDFISLWPGVGGSTAFVLCVEGSVVTGRPVGGTYDGEFCEVGPMVPGSTDETMLNAFITYARQATAVLAIGTCASYGGIPKLNTADKTKALGCSAVLKQHGIKTPVINVPGCPAHPDWIVGTIVAFLAKGLDGITLDSKGRPLDFYGGYVCNGNQGQVSLLPDDNACPWRYNNDGFLNASYPAMVRGEDNNADDPAFPIGESRGLAKYKWGSVPVGESYYDETTTTQPYGAGHMFEGCLGVLGCRGRKTHADCAYRKWNAHSTLTPGTLGVNWCVGSRGGCQGCTEPDFPMLKRFYTFV